MPSHVVGGMFGAVECIYGDGKTCFGIEQVGASETVASKL